MDVSNILDPLNSAQREAVTAPLGSCLVLAGAGSGKTRVLVHRIAWLVATEGISPFGILAVTFTNKAAAEMRGRIEAMLGASLRGMWVGTFHGIAHRLLRTHWHEAGLPQNFQILDADDQHRLIKRVTASLSLDEKRWSPRQSMWFINANKDEGLRPRHLEDEGDSYRSTMIQIYRAYEEACERGGMVDFAELLLRAHELWLNDARLLAHYRERFRALLVDEFQDTNSIQYAWLRVLAGEEDKLMVVGDDDQSIYGWRGARIENIQQFGRDFPSSQTVRLEQNYRSTSNILDGANALIEKNEGRLGKSLWTEGAKGDLINCFAAYNEVDEARFIVERIRQWADEGNLRSEAAVLYRANAQSRVLEEALIRADLPYRIYGGQRFFERLEIKNALAYLRLLSNRDADAAFERVVNTPTRGIGDRTLQQIRMHARTTGMSLWEASIAILSEDILASRAKSAIARFLQLIDTLDDETRQLDLSALVERMLEKTELIAYHRQEGGERGLARVENLQELVNASQQFEVYDRADLLLPEGAEAEGGSGMLLEEFLNHAALEAGEAQGDENQDCVQLMTLHSAKGLEFPLVFVAGMEEGLFPSQMSLDEPGRLEEERRLCYVGMTRAMARLCLTYAETRRMNGAENYNRPSRFIAEIPDELIEEIRVREQPSAKAKPPRRTTAAPTDVPDTGLRLGSRVRHAKFGDGFVLNYEGSGRHARVQVNFDSSGSKWLILSYANLEALE